MQKAKNISESLCRDCPNDDDEDDYYYDDDDDDDFHRRRRNVEAESPDGTVEGLVGLAQIINSRVVDRTKSLMNAGLDAVREAVKVAFAVVSESLNPSETGLVYTIFDNSSQMVQRIRRSTPDISDFVEDIKSLLGLIIIDSEIIARKVYQSFSSQVQTMFLTLSELFKIIWQSIFNGAPDRKRRALDSDAQFNSPLDQSLIEVKRVILDVAQKMKGQVLKTLQEMSRFVQDYKSRLERGRRSINDTTPGTNDASKESNLTTTPPNPLVKGLNELTNLTESVSDILDVVFDLTDIFSLRRKRDIDDEETESETSLAVVIEDMENGTLQVLANTKELIGRTIQELGQNVDLGLQRISSALLRQRRNAEDQLEDIKMFLRELPNAISTHMKKWFEEAKIRVIAPPSSLEDYEETDESEVELEEEKVVSRNRRFALMDTLVGMLVAKATSKVTDWVYETAKYLTSDYPKNPQPEEQYLNTINRIKRESDKSLLTEIIGLPGRVLEGIMQRGRKRADAIRKVIIRQETEDDSDDIYPGRR